MGFKARVGTETSEKNWQRDVCTVQIAYQSGGEI